jgi:hypothetical protein
MHPSRRFASAIFACATFLIAGLGDRHVAMAPSANAAGVSHEAQHDRALVASLMHRFRSSDKPDAETIARLRTTYEKALANGDVDTALAAAHALGAAATRLVHGQGTRSTYGSRITTSRGR